MLALAWWSFLKKRWVGLPARHFDVGVESGGVGHCEVRGLQSPEPIALGTAGDIHPRSATVTEEVLHLDDGGVCGAVEGHLDQHVTRRELAAFTDVALEVLFGGSVEALVPPLDGVVVVGSRVHHAVLGMVVGQIIRPTLGIKEGPLQDAHARKFEFVPESVDRRGNVAEVFRDEGELPEFFGQLREQLTPGRSSPFAVAGVFGVSGNFVRSNKSDEVIDAYEIESVQRHLHPLGPP